MAEEEIRLPRSVINLLLAHAQRERQREVCGLVGAIDGIPCSVYPVANDHADPAHRFAMAPQGQIAAMRRMREAGESLFAIYHSHPHSAAVPSPIDLAQAAYPEALYLIVSLNTEGVLEMRGFRLGTGSAVPVTLTL